MLGWRTLPSIYRDQDSRSRHLRRGAKFTLSAVSARQQVGMMKRAPAGRGGVCSVIVGAK
jgi:hypothetical protein